MEKKRAIIWYGLAIVPIMLLTMYTLTRLLGKTAGYIMGYSIYLCLALGGICLFDGLKSLKANAYQVIRNRYNIVYYILAFVPVIATFFVAFLPSAKNYTVCMLIITAIYAILNGTLEELFWRYTYQTVFKNQVGLSYIWPTLNFTCWHFALLFAAGMTYHGGGVALVGGAGVMGMLWGLMMYKAHNIKIAIVAHIGANFFAFSQLIYENWFC